MRLKTDMMTNKTTQVPSFLPILGRHDRYSNLIAARILMTVINCFVKVVSVNLVFFNRNDKESVPPLTSVGKLFKFHFNLHRLSLMLSISIFISVHVHTPHLNRQSLVRVPLTPTYSIIPYVNTISDLLLLYLSPLFQTKLGRKMRPMCNQICG
jgi:hypothetical protein